MMYGDNQQVKQHYNGPANGASGMLGSAANQQRNDVYPTPVTAPPQPQELDRVAERLNSITAHLYGMDQRLVAIADRLFGSAPTGAGGDKSAGLPSAAISVLDSYCSNANDILERISGTITRLERL